MVYVKNVYRRMESDPKTGKRIISMIVSTDYVYKITQTI
jgi:hypothetical protein